MLKVFQFPRYCKGVFSVSSCSVGSYNGLFFILGITGQTVKFHFERAYDCDTRCGSWGYLVTKHRYYCNIPSTGPLI